MANPGQETNALAQRLREARRLSGLSQAQVASIRNMHRPTISEIEAGRRRVAAEELADFAELYGVTMDWLLGKEDPAMSLKAIVAARELQKMKPEDLDTLIDILAAIKGAGNSSA